MTQTESATPATPDLAIFDNLKNLKSLAENSFYERVGSIVYWELSKLSLPYNEACQYFTGTDLLPYLEKVRFNDAVKRFATKVAALHGNLYGKSLKFAVERGKGNFSAFYFCSFYTGKIDSKEKSKYTEHAKILVIDPEDDDPVCQIESCDEVWLVSSKEEAESIFEDCFHLTNSDIAKSLGIYANEIGLKFTRHGGHYFIPHKHSEALYQIKQVFKALRQRFSITPIIAGCEDDCEEILELIGKDFKEKLEAAERELFEIGVKLFNYKWDAFSEACLARDLEAANAVPLTKTRYGKKLMEKVTIFDRNACETEYQTLVLEMLSQIKPKQAIQSQSLYRIRKSLQESVVKLQTCTEPPLVQKYYSSLLDNIADVNATIQKLSSILVDEVLDITF